MNLADRALIIAVAAHRGQTDKGGAPYIWHPIRVALNFDTDDLRLVALLHDVLEDSDFDEAGLRRVFGDTITDAVVAMTKISGQSYSEFIEQCAANPLAKAVKLADLADNMDASRLPQPLSDADVARIEKYAKAVAQLKAVG